MAIQDAEITEHIGYVTLERTVLQSYGHLHFKMEDSSGATTLTNSGKLSSATANLAGGTFVTVSVVELASIPRYENTPIQIYRKFHLQKLKIFR